MYRQSNLGVFFMFLGFFIGSPFLFYYGLFIHLTTPVYVTTLAATATATTVGVTAGLIAGIAGLAVYAAVGLLNLIHATRETYAQNTNVLDVFKSRFNNPEDSTVAKIARGINAVLWSPFLALGALLGMGTKALVNNWPKSAVEPAANVPTSSSHRTMECCLPPVEANSKTKVLTPASAHQNPDRIREPSRAQIARANLFANNEHAKPADEPLNKAQALTA